MPDDTVPKGEAFPETPWSLIGRAVDRRHKDHRVSFEELIRRYLPALRAHLVYSKRLAPDRADDLLQSFLADKVVERGIVARAQREKGKFRTFLLTALTRYYVDEIRKSKAQKRSPGEVLEIEESNEPVTKQGAASAFDVEWARQIVGEATRRTEAECIAANRPQVWQMLKARILDPALQGIEPLEYQELMTRFSLQSPLQASNLLVTGKRMYARNLKAVIAEYAADESEIEEELRDLRTVLAGAIL